MKWDKTYKVFQIEGFSKTLSKNLPRELKKVLDRKIKYLSENPQHPSLNTKQLTVSSQELKRIGVDEVWEFRINMSFRCVFYVRHATKDIILALAGNHEVIKRRFPN